MIDFSKESVINLRKIDNGEVNRNIPALMIEGETLIGVYKTVRDQIVFTSKRVIAIDVQGITGKRQEYSSLPYRMIQYFSVRTPGFLELFPDCELELFFANGMHATFEFKGACDIIEIGKMISRYTLGE